VRRTLDPVLPGASNNQRLTRSPLLSESPRAHSRRSGLQPAGLSSRVAHLCLHRERTRNLRTIFHNFWYVTNIGQNRVLYRRLREILKAVLKVGCLGVLVVDGTVNSIQGLITGKVISQRLTPSRRMTPSRRKDHRVGFKVGGVFKLLNQVRRSPFDDSPKSQRAILAQMWGLGFHSLDDH
jgi:hypothetical protein